jgi:hypothetical protein
MKFYKSNRHLAILLVDAALLIILFAIAQLHAHYWQLFHDGDLNSIPESLQTFVFLHGKLETGKFITIFSALTALPIIAGCSLSNLNSRRVKKELSLHHLRALGWSTCLKFYVLACIMSIGAFSPRETLAIFLTEPHYFEVLFALLFCVTVPWMRLNISDGTIARIFIYSAIIGHSLGISAVAQDAPFYEARGVYIGNVPLWLLLGAAFSEGLWRIPEEWILGIIGLPPESLSANDVRQKRVLTQVVTAHLILATVVSLAALSHGRGVDVMGSILAIGTSLTILFGFAVELRSRAVAEPVRPSTKISLKEHLYKLELNKYKSDLTAHRPFVLTGLIAFALLIGYFIQSLWKESISSTERLWMILREDYPISRLTSVNATVTIPKSGDDIYSGIRRTLSKGYRRDRSGHLWFPASPLGLSLPIEHLELSGLLFRPSSGGKEFVLPFGGRKYCYLWDYRVVPQGMNRVSFSMVYSGISDEGRKSDIGQDRAVNLADLVGDKVYLVDKNFWSAPDQTSAAVTLNAGRITLKCDENSALHLDESAGDVLMSGRESQDLRNPFE